MLQEDNTNLNNEIDYIKLIESLQKELSDEKNSNCILKKVIKAIKVKITVLGKKLYGKVFKSFFEKIQRDQPIVSYSTDCQSDKFRNYKQAENLTVYSPSEDHIKNINIIHDVIKNPIHRVSNHKKFSLAMDNINSETIISSKSMAKFTLLKAKRESSASYFSLNEYTTIVLDHYNFINNFVDTKKSLTDSEIIKIKSLSFSSLDLLLLAKHTNPIISEKDVDNSIYLFENSFTHSSFHKAFDFDYLKKSIEPYLYLPLEINFIITKCLNNIYGLNNITYLDFSNISQSKYTPASTPYNFYILKYISGDIRYWELDCRLENLIESLVEYLINFYTILFRKTYYNIYSHNMYKQDFKLDQSSYIGIIFNNLSFISNKSFYTTLTSFIKSNMKLNPTISDKFNLFSNNTSNLQPESDNYQPESYTIVKNLFDEISESNISIFIETNTIVTE
jgi:hypothetical protein